MQDYARSTNFHRRYFCALPFSKATYITVHTVFYSLQISNGKMWIFTLQY